MTGENFKYHSIKFFFLITAVVVVSSAITYFIFTVKYTRFYANRRLPSLSTHLQSAEYVKPKRILLWNSYFNRSDWWDRNFFRILNEECPQSFCEFVHDRRLIASADALVFHPYDLKIENYAFPTFRRPEQIWIFYSMESAGIWRYLHHINFTKMNNLFNWTMTYRVDSDVPAPYGTFVPLQLVDTGSQTKDYWSQKKNKSKMVAWMVTHCGALSNRDAYVKELLHYLNVDVYGLCGKKKCGKSNNFYWLDPGQDDPCKSLINDYYFYLSFENSICDGYVTEKMFKVLKLDTIPVVLGGGNYTKITPPNSIINVLDFNTPAELATYLLKVASNKTLYNSYFEWRKYFRVDLGDPYNPLSCALCKKLHDINDPGYNKTYPDFQQWFAGNGTCARYVPVEDRSELRRKLSLLLM